MREGVGCGQHGEDRILSLVFRDQADGFLVDVGAADGYMNSNSVVLLKRLGWRAVLIEPEATQFGQLQARYVGRDGVTCVQCAIGTCEGEQTLFTGEQVSTFDHATKRSAEDVHSIKFGRQQSDMRKLTRVLAEHDAPHEIDFLSIDAEGMNYDVWRSLDQSVFSPGLVCMEGHGYRMDGYRHLCRLGANSFYLREDICDAL